MNYNKFSLEIDHLLKRLNESGFYPVKVNNGEEVIKLKGENREDYLGHNARLDEASENVMSVEDSTVTFHKTGKFVANAYFVLGNEPGVIMADSSWSPEDHNFKEFEKVSKKASDEFVTWTELNEEFFPVEEDLRYALGEDYDKVYN